MVLLQLKKITAFNGIAKFVFKINNSLTNPTEANEHKRENHNQFRMGLGKGILEYKERMRLC